MKVVYESILAEANRLASREGINVVVALNYYPARLIFNFWCAAMHGLETGETRSFYDTRILSEYVVYVKGKTLSKVPGK